MYLVHFLKEWLILFIVIFVEKHGGLRLIIFVFYAMKWYSARRCSSIDRLSNWQKSTIERYIPYKSHFPTWCKWDWNRSIYHDLHSLLDWTNVDAKLIFSAIGRHRFNKDMQIKENSSDISLSNALQGVLKLLTCYLLLQAWGYGQHKSLESYAFPFTKRWKCNHG